jgi:hypothetical protein
MDIINLNFSNLTSLFANPTNSPSNIIDRVNQRVAQKEDKVEISASAKVAQEQKKIKESDDEVAPKQNAAIDAVIADAIAEGKKIPKPDEEMDDLQWGMMVKLGKEMGLNDADAIASLTDRDVGQYYMASRNGDVTEDYWKDVFLTDEKGNFVKVDGKVQRNPDFEGMKLFDAENLSSSEVKDMAGFSSAGEYVYPEHKSPTKLISVRPEAIMALTATLDDHAESFMSAMSRVLGSSNGKIWAEDKAGTPDFNADLAKQARRVKMDLYARTFHVYGRGNVYTSSRIDQYA